MSILREEDHAPLARLDYGWDWELSEGDTILTSVWSINSVDMTLSGQQIDGYTTSTFVEGGVAGTVYYLKNLIETSEGRKDNRTIALSCKNL